MEVTGLCRGQRVPNWRSQRGRTEETQEVVMLQLPEQSSTTKQDYAQAWWHEAHMMERKESAWLRAKYPVRYTSGPVIALPATCAPRKRVLAVHREVSHIPERLLDTVTCSDALAFLRTLPDESINCVVTSPPYFGLRDYGAHGQMGLEDSPQAYVARMIELFREVRRILRYDGVMWLNLGDSYWTGKGQSGQQGMEFQQMRVASGVSFSSPSAHVGGQKKIAPKDKPHEFYKSKDLMMMPHRVAIALQDDGWWVRNDCVWSKPNSMPESVQDRFSRAHEYVFQLAKSKHYWFDIESVRQEASNASLVRINQKNFQQQKGGAKDYGLTGINTSRSGRKTLENFAENPGRNMRSVLTIATESNELAHFATFAQLLIEPLILAGCPPQVCVTCGEPYQRDVDRQSNYEKRQDRGQPNGKPPMVDSSGWKPPTVIDKGFSPTCNCVHGTRPGIVLDMFMGSGTTGLVARRLGRHYIGCDLNPEYVQMANDRLAQSDPFQPTKYPDGTAQLSLFAGVEVE